jgi:hypothetical protein
MGSFFSVSTIDDEEELDRRRNFKFIIPSDRLLCAAQLDLLRAEGVFQGVPFVIGTY